MRIRTESPAESAEPILSGHGAEQRSMERNYQSPARFRHAAAVVLPPRSISPDPSDYLLNISAVLVSISVPPSLSFLSFCPAPVCSSARPRADTLLIAYVCTLRFHTYIHTECPEVAGLTLIKDSSISDIEFFLDKIDCFWQKKDD